MRLCSQELHNPRKHMVHQLDALVDDIADRMHYI